MVLLYGVGQRVFKVVLDTAVDGEPQAVPLGGKTLGLVALLQCVAPGVDSVSTTPFSPVSRSSYFSSSPATPALSTLVNPSTEARNAPCGYQRLLSWLMRMPVMLFSSQKSRTASAAARSTR